MAGTRDIQNSFNAGELSPLMLGRSDVAAYGSGLAICENWILTKPGGLERRPGTRFVAHAYRSDVRPRLVRFHVSQENSFALELSQGFFRVYTAGSILILATWQLDAASSIDAGTDELLITNHGFFDGAGPFRVAALSTGVLPGGLLAGQDYYVDLPAIALITAADAGTNTLTAANRYTAGMGPFRLRTTGALPTGLNTQTDYYVRAPTATTFQLALTPGGAAIDLTAVGSGVHSLIPQPDYVRSKIRLRAGPEPNAAILPITGAGSGQFTLTPQGEIPARFPHPYSASQLFELDYAQSGDLMYVAHNAVPPHKIVRHSNAHWSCEEVELWDGPYLLEQETFPKVADPDVKLQVSAITGEGITVTATKAVFSGLDVGRPLRWAREADPLKWGWGVIVGVSPLLLGAFTSKLINPGEWNAATDTVTTGAPHGFVTGEPVKFSATDGGVTAGTVYWLNCPLATSFTVHTNYDDAISGLNPVNLAALGAGITAIGGHWTATAHGIPNRVGPVALATTGSVHTGLSLTAAYWLEPIDANTLMLRDTATGLPGVPDALDGVGTTTVNGSSVPSMTCLLDVREDFTQALVDSSLWRLGAFGKNPNLGYPKAVCFHEQRLVYGGSVAEPQTLFFSQSGDFEGFAPDVDDGTGDQFVTQSSGLILSIGADVASRILWMTPMRVLVVGCLDGPWVVQAPVSEAISGVTIPVTRRQAVVGIGPQKPVAKSVALVFTGHSPGYAYAASFDVDQDAIVPSELMVLASHLADHGALEQLAESGPPLDTVWAVRADGQVLSLTFDPAQEITAWARFLLAPTEAGPAVVESVATISDPVDGDQLWLAVRRTIGGATVRTIEVMAPRFRTASLAPAAHFVDAGLDRSYGAPTLVIDQLDHLEGETVAILADGAVQAPREVVGGQITLDEAATRVHVGLAYQSYAEMLPPEIPMRFGTQVSMLQKRIVYALARIFRTQGLEVGRSRADLAILDLRRLRSDSIGAAVPLYSGVVEIPMTGGWESDPKLAFGSSAPLPCHVLSVLERLEWSDR